MSRTRKTRRTTVKKNSKKAAPKVKPQPQGRRSSSSKPAKRTADTRANQAFKTLMKGLQKKEGQE